MSDKAVTQMTDPEYTVEFDGKETYVMHNGVKLVMRRDDRWVSIEPGITVRDIVANGRHGIEASDGTLAFGVGLNGSDGTSAPNDQLHLRPGFDRRGRISLRRSAAVCVSP